MFIFAHVLVRALVDGPSFPPTDAEDHTSVRSPCSRAHFGRAITACVSSPRHWAVSIGPHKQQDMDISKASSRLGAPFLLQNTVNVRNLDLQIGDNFP